MNLVYRSSNKAYVEDLIKVSKEESEILFREDIANGIEWRIIDELEKLLASADQIN